jgi:hypothetical protein
LFLRWSNAKQLKICHYKDYILKKKKRLKNLILPYKRWIEPS